MFNITSESQIVIFILLLTLWVLPWKGVALWKAAKQGQKIWFVVLLVVNTLAILEILYIFVFSKKIRINADKTQIDTGTEKISADK